MAETIDADWFFNIPDLRVPKEITSLTALWGEMFPKQAGDFVRERLFQLGEVTKEAQTDPGALTKLDDLLNCSEDVILYSIVRVLHLKNHLFEVDETTDRVEEAPKIKGDPAHETKLILRSFLDYIKENGPDKFLTFIHTVSLRLVSTVHPNETERNTNLKHYNTISKQYVEWRKYFDSLDTLSLDAPEYKIRRETLNQLRRAIKAEMEGVWQSDQMRREPIPVESEALRILERYRVIFRALPPFVKFVKFLVREAFLLHQGSVYFDRNPEWRAKFLENLKAEKTSLRQARHDAIKKTFADLEIRLQLPRITKPLITFATWKGGDRDGNPFVVAAFTNSCFVQQKQFVLQEYIAIASQLLDKLTPSTAYLSPPPALEKSIQQERKVFPYIQNVKPHEPFRVKVRYILEKLRNSLNRVNEVIKGAGTTTRPLLGETIPGPSGYEDEMELRADLNLLYESLLNSGGKSQARSLLQDLHILVDTFGLHLTAIHFRQLSERNSETASEYLRAAEFYSFASFPSKGEKEKQSILLDLLLQDIELSPWLIPQLSSISRDTLETFLIFANAATMSGKLQETRAVGKFIISMCTCCSDILVVLFLMKLVGMLQVKDGRISECPFDVTGLFETIADLKAVPRIVKELLSIPLIRDYIVEHRRGRLTVMLGYSDSVRNGSALASDAQLLKSESSLRQVQDELNQGVPSEKHIHLVFYRGRGDTIPRGFGGSIAKAIGSQWFSTVEEDHTEQNRFLRCYASESSAVDHFHQVYSAHVSAQLERPVKDISHYAPTFVFYGRISQAQWLYLVSPLNGGVGDVYFDILRKYTILQHLPKSHFASRPVARDGVNYNIDTIRAIPFTMILAQLREFTTGYYGTGTAFERGIQYLEDKEGTALQLTKCYLDEVSDSEEKKFYDSLTNPKETESLASLIRIVFKVKTSQDIDKVLSQAKDVQRDEMLWKVVKLYDSCKEAVEEIAKVILDNTQKEQTPLQVLQEMYQLFPPFRYSIENKEAALLIRNKTIVDDYTRNATPEERNVLNQTEEESQLAKKWVLQITKQQQLKSKTLTTDFNSNELFLLHKIQSKFLSDHIKLEKEGKAKNQKLERKALEIQMTILAVSEALGFAG